MLVVGCGHGTASVQAPSAPTDPRFALIVGGELGTAEGQRPLVQAKAIHANEHLVFTISASRPVTVFVAYCDSRGKQQVYGPLLAGPDMTIDVPQRGYFLVDHNTGLEHVFVVAAAKPLQTADPTLDRALRAQSGEDPCADNLAMTTKESRGQRTDEDARPTTTSSPPPLVPPIVATSVAPGRADNLAMATKESRAERADEGGPPATASPLSALPVQPNVVVGAPAQRPRHYPTSAGRYRIRGMNPHEDTAATVATRSDEDGIAIIAFTFDHQ